MKISTLIEDGYKLAGVSVTCLKEGNNIGKYIVYMGKGNLNIETCEKLFLNEDAVEILKTIYWNEDIILKV